MIEDYLSFLEQNSLRTIDEADGDAFRSEAWRLLENQMPRMALAKASVAMQLGVDASEVLVCAALACKRPREAAHLVGHPGLPLVLRANLLDAMSRRAAATSLRAWAAKDQNSLSQ
jgi:hypothetical protein